MDYSFPKELLSFCRVMGVFPAESISYGRIDKLKFSVVTFLYSLALVVTQVCISYYNLFWICREFSNETSMKCDTKIGVLIMFCDSILLTGLAIISVVSSGRGCHSLIELYQVFERFDTALQTRVDQSYMRKWLIVTVVYLTILIAMETGVIFVFSVEDPTIWAWLIYGYPKIIEHFPLLNSDSQFEMGLMSPAYLSVLTLHYTVLAVQLKFLSVVDGIRCRFSLLNNKISEEVTRHRFKGLNKFNMFTISPDVEELVETKEYSTVYPMSIQSLSDLHWALCGAIHKTNTIFSWQLLLFMMLLFHQIIATPYYLFNSMGLYARSQHSSLFLFQLATQLLWMLTHFSKLVLLIWPCSMTTQEGSKTAPILCKHLNKEMSPHMKKQLETFLLQLLHNSAEFSVFGLFNLQCPILTSIAGAVTTYLVILIQFQHSDGKDTNN